MWSDWYFEIYPLEQLAFMSSCKLVLSYGWWHKQTLVTKVKISLFYTLFKIYTRHLLNEKPCTRYRGYHNICLREFRETLESVEAYKNIVWTIKIIRKVERFRSILKNWMVGHNILPFYFLWDMPGVVAFRSCLANCCSLFKA